jgi:hypothetical protein
MSLLFREFFESLVRIADFIFTNEQPNLTLFQATKKLIQERVGADTDATLTIPSGWRGLSRRPASSPLLAARQVVPYVVVPQTQAYQTAKPEARQPTPPQAKDGEPSPIDEAVVATVSGQRLNPGVGGRELVSEARPVLMVWWRQLFERYRTSSGSGRFTRRDFLRLLQDAGVLAPENLSLDDCMQVIRNRPPSRVVPS